MIIKNYFVDYPVIIRYREFKKTLNFGEEAEPNISDDCGEIYIKTLKESKVKGLNIFDVWLGTALPSEAKVNLVCEASIKVSPEDNGKTVNLISNTYREEEKYKYTSIKAVYDGLEELPTTYRVIDQKKIYKSYKNRLMWLVSGLPLIIIGAIALIIDFQWSLLGCLIILALIGLLPSIKAIKKFKNICNDENATEILNRPMDKKTAEDAAELIMNTIMESEPKSAAAKVSKVAKKVFFD